MVWHSIQEQKWRDDLGWAGLSLLGMRVMQVHGFNLIPANPARLARALPEMQQSGPEGGGGIFSKKEAVEQNLRGLIFVPNSSIKT